MNHGTVEERRQEQRQPIVGKIVNEIELPLNLPSAIPHIPQHRVIGEGDRSLAILTLGGNLEVAGNLNDVNPIENRTHRGEGANAMTPFFQAFDHVVQRQFDATPQARPQSTDRGRNKQQF